MNALPTSPIIALACAINFMTSTALSPAVDAASTTEQVWSVEELHLEVDPDDAQTLRVVAQGMASSGGWTSPRLRPRQHDATPADGMLDVDFVANRPEGNSIQVLSPVSAQLPIPLRSWIRGIRVHSRSNQVEVDLGG